MQPSQVSSSSLQGTVLCLAKKTSTFMHYNNTLQTAMQTLTTSNAFTNKQQSTQAIQANIASLCHT
jgi:hypothetical protein